MATRKKKEGFAIYAAIEPPLTISDGDTARLEIEVILKDGKKWALEVKSARILPSKDAVKAGE